MKIAFFLLEFPVTSETFILNQIVGLIQRGHEIDIHAQSRAYQSDIAQHAAVDRYRLFDHVYFHPTPSPKFARLCSAATRLAHWGWRRPAITLDSLNILRHGRAALNLTLIHDRLPALKTLRQYDVIHCHYGPSGRRAVAWRNFGAIRGPIITTFHGFDVNWLPRIEGPKLYKGLFREGEYFTVGSEFMKKRVIALGAPEDRILKLPMGVDLSRFRFTDRIETHDGELRLLTVARLVEVKGIEYAIRAVASLKSKYPRIRYKIVGDGPLRTALEGLVGFLGLGNHVEFLGALAQEKIIELYRDAQIFVLPSIVTDSGEEENQSVALAEAQASGVPVIGTRIGGNSDSIREGESGFLVPPRDFNALARAIDELAKRPEAWTKMGRVGRTHVEERFDLDGLNNRLVDLYRMVAAGG
jgi:colanic acid/amylovoran biosynthesis glycosyltransferase